MKEFKHYDELEKFVKEHKYVLVSVRPEGGCPICERYAPIFQKALPKIQETKPDLEIVILWIGEDQECIEKLDVCSPTLIFYRDGQEVDRIVVETVPEEEFEEKILEKVKEL